MNRLQAAQLRCHRATRVIGDLLAEKNPDMARVEIAQAERNAADEEWEAAFLAEHSGDEITVHDPGEAAEIAALRSQVSVGRYLAAALEGRRVQGAEEELRQAVDAQPGQIPYAAFDRPVFRNADAPTAAPNTIGVSMSPIVPAAFSDSVAEFLGIRMPMAPSGQYSIPRLSTNLTAAAKEKGGAQESSAGAFAIATAKPKRISARLSLRIEDLDEVGIPAFEAALQENLRMVLADTLDVQLLRGSNKSGQLAGIEGQLTADTDPSDAIKFATGIGDIAGYLDGKFATELRHLRFVHNPAVYGKIATLFADNDDSVTFLEWTARQGIRTVANGNMSASASNIGKSIVVRSKMVKGAEGAPAVAPVWGNLSISDPYTNSASATQHLTLHMRVGDPLIRYPDAFAQWRVKTA